ncbi:hypothetical protein PENTCL1PPCAC_11389, partial [Pristionchus entomophagus]
MVLYCLQAFTIFSLRPGRIAANESSSFFTCSPACMISYKQTILHTVQCGFILGQFELIIENLERAESPMKKSPFQYKITTGPREANPVCMQFGREISISQRLIRRILVDL